MLTVADKRGKNCQKLANVICERSLLFGNYHYRNIEDSS